MMTRIRSKRCMNLVFSALIVGLVVSMWNQNAVLLRCSRRGTTSSDDFLLHKSWRVQERRSVSTVFDDHVMDKQVPEPPARDISWQQEWPEVEGQGFTMGQLPPTVHYLWCGANKTMTFKHYLGVLSALRVVKPLLLLFHFSHSPPVIDTFMYNDWFLELRDNVPFLDIRQLSSNESCDHDLKLETVLKVLSSEGGLYLGENVVLTRRPEFTVNGTLWWATFHRFAQAKVTPDVIMVMPSIPGGAELNVSQLARDIRSGAGGSQCVTKAIYDSVGPGESPNCLVLSPEGVLHPRDIWADESSRLARLARWIFYGQRAAQKVMPDVTKPIPRVTHYVKLLSQYPMYTRELSFSHFLSILSALHVAGFHHVYLHVTDKPTGRWWEELRQENVTIVQLHASTMVFQQNVYWVKHVGDMARFNIVYKYGGGYQDFDAVWTSYLPDSLLAYPAVITPDISGNGLWPYGLSPGLFLARPGASFLRHLLKTYKKYVDELPLYNSICMPYRTQERYPSTVLVEPRLQVICFGRWCYPKWANSSQWDLESSRSREYNWTHIHALHITHPKPVPSFASPEALSQGKDMMADVGRHVLKRSGRMHLLYHTQEDLDG